jgi:hypothetical protein
LFLNWNIIYICILVRHSYIFFKNSKKNIRFKRFSFKPLYRACPTFYWTFDISHFYWPFQAFTDRQYDGRYRGRHSSAKTEPRRIIFQTIGTGKIFSMFLERELFNFLLRKRAIYWGHLTCCLYLVWLLM